MSRIAQLANHIILSLIQTHENVAITEQEEESGLLLRISVPEGERGKIIGKRGRMIHALRTLLMAVHGSNVLLEVEDG
jgi:predicted RNA-binding protein YlqC (UPF0109 family)